MMQFDLWSWKTAALSAVTLCLLSDAPAQSLEFKLSVSQLTCLRVNADVYRGANRDPLLIPLNDCPKLPEKPIFGELFAEAPTALKTGQNNELGDTFIYVTKSQFDCLVNARPHSANLYRFLPNACRLEAIE
ncbi:hypothetical protein GOL87_28105 [Sinorhizobium medicae]|nr:hypothetical protein [Sinorhizobium medicae]